MKALVFPGQGAQFEGMGKDLFENHEKARNVFQEADEVLGWSLTDVMFNGSKEDLRQTKVTQPAIFTQSIAKFESSDIDMTNVKGMAGHSLGEFSALVAAACLSFADALNLVSKRALAMQEACEKTSGTMAAVLGLDDQIIEEVCAEIDGVVAANYNSPGQLVISGELDAINQASEALKSKGAKRVLPLPVGGAFHSPLMKSAEEELSAAINQIDFADAKYPIYQNVTTVATVDAHEIKDNLLKQLTAPVKWTQSVQNMISDGMVTFVEVGGTGKVLSGLIKKIDRSIEIATLI